MARAEERGADPGTLHDMKRVLLTLVLLASACGPRPEDAPSPAASPVVTPTATATATASPAAATGAVLTLEEPGLTVRLTGSGEMTVERQGKAPEQWRLPTDAVAARLQGLEIFEPTAAPEEAGGPITLTLERDDLRQVRAPKGASPTFQQAVETVRALVPQERGSGPDDLWIAGELVHQDVEGGTWKIRVGPDKEFVLATFPEGFQAGQRVIATGSPAKAGETMGIHMAGPYYEALTLRAVPAE